MSALRHIARRLLLSVVLVFLVASAALFLTRLTPGDYASDVLGFGASAETVARARARYGLDQPLLTQYGHWVARTARLDLGTSLMYGRPVAELVGRRFLNTALLGLTAILLATLVGVPLGVLTGSGRRGVAPAIVRTLSILSVSIPPLLTSLLFVMIAARTGWLPIGGMTSADSPGAWSAWLQDVALHLPVPALALALPMAAMLERLQSQSMDETLREPFVVATLGRGVPPGRLIWRDTFCVALKPVLSIWGVIFGSLLSGSFAVEIVTSWPGLGRLMYDALRARDVYLVAGCAAAGATFIAAGTLLSDLALAFVDPRLGEEA